MHICRYLFLVFLLSSCSTTRMFQADEVADNPVYPAAPYTLRAGDKVSVSVWKNDDISVGSVHSMVNSSSSFGKYLEVDHRGNVNFPLIGKQCIAGLSREEAEQLLFNAYNQLIKNPVIELRIHDLSVTILGEVNRPGNYDHNGMGLSLLDLVGKAGGTTNFAAPERVLVIRKNSSTTFEVDRKQGYRVDLTRMDELTHNRLFLQAGDIVYVEPARKKAVAENGNRLIPFVGILSSLALIVSLIQ